MMIRKSSTHGKDFKNIIRLYMMLNWIWNKMWKIR